jgi:pimeloyl-ACP methyl ester carboxylesterase
MRALKISALSGLAVLLGACVSGPTVPPSLQPTSPPPPSIPTSAPAPTPTIAREETAAILERMGGYPCPDSDFTCVKLSVPLDHFDASAETIEMVFAVLPATGERKGMFVTVTGGPGTSGLAVADSYTSAFDPSIPEHFDIVFFDQRGVAESGGLQCAEAATAFYLSDWRAYTPEQEAAMIATAQTFVEGCVQEMGLPPERLPYYSTSQAVEDLEVFRQTMGDEKFWLYGESYGTQYAQTYAAAHPDHLAGLILDGTVDLTLSGPEFMAEQAQAFNDVLVTTLEACNADEACAADLGGDALAFYDDLAAELAASPAPFTFPLPSGESGQRSFTLASFETVVAEELYTEGSRLMLLRALAAAAHGDLVPLARLLYVDLGLDPKTLEVIPDPTWSDAIYYAVECGDYPYYGGTPARAEAYIRDGDAIDTSVPYLSSIFYGDLPCVFWPDGEVGLERPEPLVAEGVPTLVLGATADPATPVANGEQVYTHLADGYLITTQGGAHVIFGRGDPCPDEIVTAFLVEDKLPEQPETVCEGVIFDPYVPLPPPDASAFADPLEAMISADDEIYYLPEYYYWDYETTTPVGCPYGGTLTFEATDEGEAFTLSECAFSAGFAMTGSGTYDYDPGLFTLEVGVTGLADGRLTYVRDDKEGTFQVTGEYAGQPIDLFE